MKWAFQIEQTSLDRRNILDLLVGIGFQQVNIPGFEFLFWSPTFEAYERASQVWEEAKRIRYLLLDVTEIDPAVTLGAVIDLTSDQPKRHHFLDAKVRISVTTSDAILTVTPPDNLSEEQLFEYNRNCAEQEYNTKLEAQLIKLKPAFLELRAVKILKLFKQKPHTGESLYKIYELAVGHPKHQKEFHKKFGISKMDFDRFRDAVHNPVVSGELARHAYEDEPKTDNPMTIAEAESFAIGIANRWMASLCYPLII
jgi:hypothetical protein